MYADTHSARKPFPSHTFQPGNRGEEREGTSFLPHTVQLETNTHLRTPFPSHTVQRGSRQRQKKRKNVPLQIYIPTLKQTSSSASLRKQALQKKFNRCFIQSTGLQQFLHPAKLRNQTTSTMGAREIVAVLKTAHPFCMAQILEYSLGEKFSSILQIISESC